MNDPEVMKRMVNKRVHLQKPHLYAGFDGITKRVEFMESVPGLVVRLDNGTECIVFHAPEILFLR